MWIMLFASHTHTHHTMQSDMTPSQARKRYYAWRWLIAYFLTASCRARGANVWHYHCICHVTALPVLYCLPHLFTSAAVFYHLLLLSISLSLPPLTPPSTPPPSSLLARSLLPLLFLRYSWKSWENECISFRLWRLSDPTGLKVPFLSLW